MKKEKNKSITVNRIFKLIDEKQITAKEFAQSCSLAQGNVTDWKTGRAKPSIDALRKISKKYKVQIEWLTGDSKYKTKDEEFEELYKKEKQDCFNNKK